MTREEAIHFAECLKHNWTIDFNDMEDFCDMAIEALQADAVSREHHDMEIKELKHQIKDQAEMVAVVRCKDCRWKNISHKSGRNICGRENGLIWADDDNFCSYGERREP